MSDQEKTSKLRYLRRCKETGKETEETEEYVRRLFSNTFKNVDLAMECLLMGEEVNTMFATYRYAEHIGVYAPRPKIDFKHN